MKKVILALIILLAIGLYFFNNYLSNLKLLQQYTDTFSKETIAENFRTFEDNYDVVTIDKAKIPYHIPYQPNEDIFPETYAYEDSTYNTVDEIVKRDITSLLVIKDGNIIYEKYFQGNSASDHIGIFGISKSVTSVLIGIAYKQGYIESLDDPAGKYVPELNKTVYKDVTIQNLLNMSSGVKWSDNTSSLQSEIVQAILAALKGSLNDYTKKMKRSNQQGVYNQKVNMDTQVLGMILEKATNMDIQEFMQKELWSKIGAEEDAYILVDKVGYPIMYGGMLMTVRDLAKIGLMMINNGTSFLGESVLTPEWVYESTHTNEKHLVPGKNNPYSNRNRGYKNQWWIPEEPDNADYVGLGIYNQSLYINPSKNVVIVCSSAYKDFKKDVYHTSGRRIKMFQAIAAYLANKEE